MPHCTYHCTCHCTALYTVHRALYRARCQSWAAHRAPHTLDRGWSEQDTATAVIHNTAMDFVILKVGWGPFCHWCVYYVMNNVEFS